MIKKVAITGPESTGKSTLAKDLALYYKSCFVSEFARDYLFKLGRDYNYDDLLIIAKNHVQHIENALPRAREVLFVDTELINIKIWSLYKYGKCHKWILENIQKQNFDLYLLCDVDIPWTYDVLRENPDKGEFFKEWFIKELEFYKFPYRVISGSADDRFRKAISCINNI